MIRSLSLLACLPLALGACAGTTTTTVTTDAQLALTDGQAILAALEAGGNLPPKIEADATLVIDGLQAVLAADNGAATGTTEAQALAAAEAAVQQVVGDSTDARVRQAGQVALTAITAVSANASASSQTQAETALGAVLLDFLATSEPTQALAFARR